MEFTLLGAAVLGCVAMWAFTRVDPVARGAPDPFGNLLSGAVAGLITGRVVAMVTTGTNPISVDFLLVRGGVSTIGATVGALAWITWANRSDPGRLDKLAPAALMGLAGWHMGCLLRGSCLGAATNLPWGWSVSGSTIDRHPVELYAALLLVVGAIFLRTIRDRVAVDGFAVLAGLGLASISRLVTEPLRLTLGELQWFYALGTVLGLAGAAGVVVRRRHQHR